MKKTIKSLYPTGIKLCKVLIIDTQILSNLDLKRCERSTWLHERLEAHFTSHRLLLDKEDTSSTLFLTNIDTKIKFLSKCNQSVVNQIVLR